MQWSGQKRHPLLIKDYIRATVTLGKHQYPHNFIVVDHLVAPIILGIDFFHKNELVLDFTTNPVTVSQSPQTNYLTTNTHSSHSHYNKICTVLTGENNTTDIPDHCTIPSFSDNYCIELPNYSNKNFVSVVNRNKDLFRNTPGMTQEAYHYIPTSELPVKIPPRRVPAHYREEIERQLQEMLRLGIIEESFSPWMAPAIYIRKKSGDLRICIDYRELNKRTKKDSYPG